MKKKKIFSVIILAMMILSGIVIALGIKMKCSKDVLYNYNITRSTDYSVMLLPNKFYLEKALPADKYYISNAIKSIDLDYMYQFEINKNCNIDYSYNITADLVASVDEGNIDSKEVWSRRLILLDNSNGNINDNKLNINHKISVDYNYYKKLVNEYMRKYDIKVNAYLNLNFNIYYDLSDNTQTIKHIEDSIEIKIPLNNVVTNIEKNYQANTNNLIYSDKKANILNSTVLICIGIAGMLIGIIYIIVLFAKRDTNMYLRNIKYILDNYSDLIVNVKNEPNTKNLEHIKVLRLTDIINLAEQNRKNIIHYAVNGKNESRLYVTLDNNVYVYTVTENNKEK